MSKNQSVVELGPYPNRTEKLPRQLAELTPDFLTRLFRNRYVDLVVEDLKVIEVHGGHTTKVRLELILNDAGVTAGIPKNICVKSNLQRELEAPASIHELEAQFYYHFRDEAGLPIPRAYYADWEGGDDRQGIVILEDLIAEGGTFGHSSQHIGVDGVAGVLETLARLHGRWWDSSKLHESSWLPASMTVPVDVKQYRMFRHLIQQNMEKPDYMAILPDWVLQNPPRLEQVYDLLVAYEQSHCEPRCLVHGDAHLGNSYLKPNGDRIWLDWQLVRKGMPWRDVSYLMVGALTIEERRSAERDLLRHYRQCLIGTGACDVPGEDKIWQDYRLWPVYGMQAWLATLDEFGQVGLPVVERFFTAGEDLGTLALLEKQ